MLGACATRRSAVLSNRPGDNLTRTSPHERSRLTRFDCAFCPATRTDSPACAGRLRCLSLSMPQSNQFRQEQETANQNGNTSANQNRCSANVLCNPGEWVDLVNRQINGVFDCGVDRFSHQHQTDCKHQDGPLYEGKSQYQTEQNSCHGGD